MQQAVGTPLARAEDAIQQLLAAGQDGLRALKIVGEYTKNALRSGSPEEVAKFRSINRGNKAFRTRVAAFKGGEECLRAVGFVSEAPTGSGARGWLCTGFGHMTGIAMYGDRLQRRGRKIERETTERENAVSKRGRELRKCCCACKNNLFLTK